MAIKYHPERGTIIICDFKGMLSPEMSKRRPVIVVSSRPRRECNRLCTVVALSTTPPNPKMQYNNTLRIEPPLPAPYDNDIQWLKGDMIYRMSFDRLNLPIKGKDGDGKRIYHIEILDQKTMEMVENCLLHSIGLSKLVDE